MLSAHNLACARGERLIFSSIGFDLEAGQVLLVTGPNGSGKTSLLRIVCGLLEPAQGDLRWNGTSTKTLGDDYRAQLAYVGHVNGLKDDLTAPENLRIWAAISGTAVSSEAARDALHRLGLEANAHVPVRWLSQGQKRRAALARLLVGKRSLWALDEPFAGLDAASTEAIEALLVAHARDGGMALVSTHQPLRSDSVPVRRIALGR